MFGEDYLAHKWISSKDAKKRALQKEAQDAYNHKYYMTNKEKILAQRRQKYAAEHPEMTKEQVANAVTQEMLKERGQYPGYSKPGQIINGVADATKKMGQQKAWQQQKNKIPYANQTLEQVTKQIKQQHPEMYDSEAEDYARQQILSSHFSPQFEQADLDARNQRMTNTGLNQSAQVRASEMQKRQNQTLSRVSMSDAKASQAQMDTRNKANRNRRIRKHLLQVQGDYIRNQSAARSANEANAYKTARDAEVKSRKKRKHFLQVQGDYIRNQSAARSANEANAYKTARDAEVKSRKKRKHFLQVQGDYIRNQSATRSQNESNAYAANRKKQKEYNNSFEGRLSRAMNRSAKRTANVTNNIKKFFDILGRVSKNSYRNYKRYTS